MTNNRKNILIFILTIIEIFFTFLLYKSFNNRNNYLEEGKSYDLNGKNIAIMIEQKGENGSSTYVENSSTSWPTDMVFNSELSGCVDKNGNVIANSLTFDECTRTAVVNVNKTSYCYLYFDAKSSFCNDGEKAGNCLIRKKSEIVSLEDNSYSGLYRYTGTNPSNYVCFGTADKNECLNNQNKYLYRIIGVTSTENTSLGLKNGQLKLMKNSALDGYNWHSNKNTDVSWENSSMYYYLQNTILQDSNVISSRWGSKISPVKWYTGDVNSSTLANASIVANYEDNSFTSSTAKLGLVYLSDYFYAYNSGGTEDCYDIKCNSWMSDSNSSIWTMIRYGKSGSIYFAWRLYSNSEASFTGLATAHMIKPVFYLKEDEIFTSGIGSISDPFIISEPEAISLSDYIIDNSVSGLKKSIISGDNLYRFTGVNGNSGINNYICLGSTSCTSGSDNMYRIIGVNPANGEIKVIKQTTWNNVERNRWNEESKDVQWLASTLYLDNVYEIYGALSFNNMIVRNHSWNIGKVTSTDVSSRSEIISYEDNETGTSSVGIISLSDYYLAYDDDMNWYITYGGSTSNWIGLYSNNDSSEAEWTMNSYGCSDNYCRAWLLYSSDGTAFNQSFDNSTPIRPVFYLKSEVKYNGGTGTEGDPFIVKYQ